MNNIAIKNYKFEIYNFNSANLVATALEINYSIDDPRSWKTICVKCNQPRDLTKPLACCF